MEQKKCKITKVKDVILFSLLLIWIMIPNLKLIKPTSLIIGIYEYKYMQIVGLIGIYIFIFTICKKIIKSQNRKLLAKELLPIIFLMGYLIWTFISCTFAENSIMLFMETDIEKKVLLHILYMQDFFHVRFQLNLIN